MKHPLFFLLLLFLLLPKVCLAESATVTRISDGDTIIVTRHDGKPVKVRIYGIDCPEQRQPWGQEATDFVTALLPPGSVVLVEAVERDRYGRTVGMVILPDGSNLSETLVTQGFAWVYDKYCLLDECAQWRQLESVARLDKRGLWGNGNAVPPWEWRRGKR